MSQVGRNDSCPCGSGKKYKKCCEKKTYLQKKTVAQVPAATGSTVSKVASVGGLFASAVKSPEENSEGSLKNKEISQGKVDSKSPND
jgi:hypothetical protein